MKEVLVTIPVLPEHKAWLEEIGKDCHFTYAVRFSNIPEEILKKAEIILGNVRPADLQKASSLKFLQLDSAGADTYTLPGVLPEGVFLSNASGAYGRTISEYMIAAVFSLLKKLPAYEKNQAAHLWKDEGKITMVEGSRTLVIGLGDIGGQFARKMHALGSRVTGIRRIQSNKPDYLEKLCQMDRLEELLPQADIVACTLPGTPETKRLLNRERLSLMKPGSLLINVGRGNLIDPDALYDALTNGPLKAAALDVTDPEPLPADSPLWDLPNLIITPHVSGNYHSDDILNSAVRIAGENLKAYLEGRPLSNPVDLQTGYRKSIEKL